MFCLYQLYSRLTQMWNVKHFQSEVPLAILSVSFIFCFCSEDEEEGEDDEDQVYICHVA